ncbi:cation:proton antiporter [Ramlibacter sp. AW1]|uniref:Cation:proton antiporter n=1 Tax=Ramlibacter aurantiacus TaxID=2801330 RepID=A0A936ZVP3_9BURK|nr:cation:proton antiporter [Ramlibacter aurantiacus]MBL0421424.1 cation:proton antiporter [Ramlibacter aurantiacus]
MIDHMAIWSAWLRTSAGLPAVQWSLLLALAAAAGHLVQRHMGLPKVVGYSVVGAIAGLAGFGGDVWPLNGISLFVLELGVSLVLFEAGGRLALRWFRHNPMVLLQSLLEAVFTYALVYYTMRWLGMTGNVAEALAIIGVVSSPAVLSRVRLDTRATGPVTERALALTTLGSLYALALVSARTRVMHLPRETLMDTLLPIGSVLGLSLLVGVVLALVLRLALRIMSPTSENTSMLLLTLIGATAALAGHFGGSAALAALIGGLVLKQFNPRPFTWPRQLGTAGSLLIMLTFVLVSVVAARASWNSAVAGVVLALLAARFAGKVLGVGTANWGSGLGWQQAFWTACAMQPLSAVALLLVAQYATSSLTLGPQIAAVALPAILVMEALGAIVATLALYATGESSRALSLQSAAEGPPSTPAGTQRG